MTTEQKARIIEQFEIPKEAEDLLEFFFTEEDRRFIAEFSDGELPVAEINKAYRDDAFRRGIISKTDETGTAYKLNNFYGFLDVFAVSQTEKLHSLPREKRRALDAWYFRAYADGLDPDRKKRPTSDKVITREEMLAFIEKESRPLYLNYCDCKSLGGDCGKPTHTCINFEPGINSFKARGLSEPLTKEAAKQVIEDADKAGLVHTISSHGICNCCSDCCYLFRGQRERGSVGFWPESAYLITFDRGKCIGCGRCLTRCMFGVFERAEAENGRKGVKADRRYCIGCGLCERTCPAGALKLAPRPDTFIQIAGKYSDEADVL
ncbi:MAG: 4Fe-4S binding protein [Lachnospiraceae bacterium]|nr:4Fe-4S binding protein [Lachnospiraceae bacterium]